MDAFLDYWFRNDIRLDYELIRFIKEIKKEGKYLALASQQEFYRKNHIWEKLGLEKIFDTFYCTSEIGYLKSDVEFYSYMLNDLKRQKLIKSPEGIIFFDDSKKIVETARKIGIEACMVNSNKKIYEDLKARNIK